MNPFNVKWDDHERTTLAYLLSLRDFCDFTLLTFFLSASSFSLAATFFFLKLLLRTLKILRDFWAYLIGYFS